MTDRLSRMSALAGEVLGSLDPQMRARASRPFPDDEERQNWFYWPGPREGVALGELSAAQAMGVHKLVASVLSLHAFGQVTAIESLEHVLDEIEGGNRFRDPGLYHLTIFGNPGSDAWSWRFEGHHVSIHVTVVGEEVSVTPLFLGANPASVMHLGQVVLRPLGPEEDVARSLLDTLGPTQLELAVVAAEAPSDILTSNDPRVDPAVLAGGIPASVLRADQVDRLAALVDVYLDRLGDDWARTRRARLSRDRLSFAWAGSTERGAPHYYRLWGPGFLAEYDNTQDDANHVHAVLRDPDGDFGRDLLRDHLRTEHGG